MDKESSTRGDSPLFPRGEDGFKPIVLSSQSPLIQGAQYEFPEGVREALEEHFSGALSSTIVCEEGFGDPTNGILSLEGPGNFYFEWGFTPCASMKARFRCTGLTSPSRRSATVRSFLLSKEKLREIETKVRQQRASVVVEDAKKPSTKGKKEKKVESLFASILANL